MKKNIYVVLACILVFVSCGKTNEPVVSTVKNEVKVKVYNTATWNQATNKMDTVVGATVYLISDSLKLTAKTDNNGIAENGILLRHLVLPGHAAESKKVLRTIAEEISTGIHLSLMSQYHPTGNVRNHPAIDRILYKDEYESVVKEMERLGFRNGWVQDIESHNNYIPDFSKNHPFK